MKHLEGAFHFFVTEAEVTPARQRTSDAHNDDRNLSKPPRASEGHEEGTEYSNIQGLGLRGELLSQSAPFRPCGPHPYRRRPFNLRETWLRSSTSLLALGVAAPVARTSSEALVSRARGCTGNR